MINCLICLYLIYNLDFLRAFENKLFKKLYCNIFKKVFNYNFSFLRTTMSEILVSGYWPFSSFSTAFVMSQHLFPLLLSCPKW